MGDPSQRELRKFYPIVDQINVRYEQLAALSDDQLRQRVQEIKADIQGQIQPMYEEIDELMKRYREEADDGEKNSLNNDINERRYRVRKETQSILDDYLVEVYAIVKDTCRRLVGSEINVRGHITKWDMIPFDVQLLGGIVLHKGYISEMATGEGKTLVATLPIFLNALTGRGVHLVTVNNYLAQRDAEWMGTIYTFHGLTVGYLPTENDYDAKREAYLCDITYGMNSDYGFDYLRDNMAVSPEQIVQRDFYYAIVDEVDNILIDEARTPLIISGPVAEDKNFFEDLKPQVFNLVSIQNDLINRFLSEARNLMKDTGGDQPELAKRLLLVKRGAPRNKAFLKLMKEGDLKKITTDLEGYYLRDKKMHELDDELFFAVDEKAHSVDVCEKGRNYLSKQDPDLFIMDNLDDVLREIDENDDLSYEKKQELKLDKTNQFMDKNERLHNISQLLKAYMLFERDVDYVVDNNEVMIVDEFTGRLMAGRRFSDGLHQALEAKESVRIEKATQTLATITLQNYFRMYEKLGGMTGTAITEEAEFMEIYGLKVVEVPTNRSVSRIDHDDVIYLTKNEKYNAIIQEIEYWHKLEKPVLVGTVSVEVSETISRLLRRRNIPHHVLNAKYHQNEAEIVMRAGQAGAVTIATNMAGRGTDIKLGDTVVTQEKETYLNLPRKISDDNPFGLPLDGLHVIGSERHESRRIDRQLRGRAGRQGDPGTSRFYLSLEDDLMRLFGSDRMAPMMIKLGVKEGEAIAHPWMTKAVERAQKKVEEHNFEIRKQLIKYDEVMNQQREVIYTYRRNVLKGYDLKGEILDMIRDANNSVVNQFIDAEVFSEDWPIEKIQSWYKSNCNIELQREDLLEDRMTVTQFEANLEELILLAYAKREEQLGSDMMREIERRVLLEVVDDEWRDHLHEMDLMKESIGLRAYGNKDPLVEYKRESYSLFQSLIARIQENVAKRVFTTYILTAEQAEEMRSLLKDAQLSHNEMSAFQAVTKQQQEAQTNEAAPMPKIQPMIAEKKVGRNDPCPCGSGKKYKKCCGKMESFDDEE